MSKEQEMTTLEWETEDHSSDAFPDLVWHSAHSRGGQPSVSMFGCGNGGARTYIILDCTDPHDGRHVSRLELSSYQHDGWINSEGDVVDDEGDCDEAFEWEKTFEPMEIATATFDDLDAAKAEAQRWEAMRIEKSWRGDKWELVDE
jgi:hypothetical protein